MKSIPLALVLSLCASPLVACEGEPPMSPADIAPPSSSAAEISAEESPSAAPKPVAQAAPSAAIAAPATSAEAAPSSSAAVAAAPPPTAIAHANITGKVVAAPATMSKFAIVWLEDGPADARPPKNVSIDNRQMSFIPFVQVAPVGAKVIFSNADPFPHNVFTPDNERFNLGNIGQHAAAVRVFKQPAQYSLLCNLHPGMLGYLVVTPSSWFSKVGKDGTFTIKDVPPGTYKVTAWAPRNALITQSVTVKDGDATVGFELHR